MKRIGLVLPLLLYVFVARAAADRGGFVIRSFDADIQVAADAGMEVTERIEVEFLEQRHGIYRTIPVRYTDPVGYDYALGFQMLGVTDDNGVPQPYRMQRDRARVNIRIGSASRFVNGPVVYRVRYRVRNALRHFPEHDELYWNVTGTEWGTTIDEASATVHLPPVDGVPKFAWYELAGFTGSYGGRERDVAIDEPATGTAHWITSQPLGAREGLTIVGAWPHGVVKFPSALEGAMRFVADNVIVVVPFIAGFGLWWQYRRRGRDPVGAGSVVVRYEPPEGVPPGVLGTVIDEKVDLRDITATIVDLAVRGHLTIESSESGECVFQRCDPEPDDRLFAYERLIVSGLFDSSDHVEMHDLRESFFVHLGGIRDTLYQLVVSRGYFDRSPQTVRVWTIALGVVAGVATSIAGALWAGWRGSVMPNALILPAVSGSLTLILFAAFARAMPCRTKKGVELRAWGLGFEEFIDRVEKDNLEMDEARTVFEKLLPYAVALGVAARWARRFEGIYEGANRPEWYSIDDATSRLSTRGFERSLHSTLTQAERGMVTGSRSFGASGVSGGFSGGGGGFSGGGGGGGGGGSW